LLERSDASCYVSHSAPFVTPIRKVLKRLSAEAEWYMAQLLATFTVAAILPVQYLAQPAWRRA